MRVRTRGWSFDSFARKPRSPDRICLAAARWLRWPRVWPPVPLLRANTALGKSRDERLIRPPGALDETDFLSRCIRCGECMKVCPNNSLQPAFAEAGLEGIWTPTLTPRIGYCEPSCVLCSEVCPTGAIWKISPQEKGWVVGLDSPGTRSGSRFAWAPRSTTVAAVCPGPWPPVASCARSGVRYRRKQFTCRKRRLWMRTAIKRRCSSHISTRAVASAAERASMPARCRNILRCT